MDMALGGRSTLLAGLLLACKFSSEGLGEDGASASASDESSAGAVTTGEPGETTAASVGSSNATPPNCGDGVRDADEACDDGADNGADQSCTPVCTVNTCGDGYPRAGMEDCDDGNAADDDACVRCEVAVCGDGYVYKNVESCDAQGVSAACDGDCSTVMCGDGTVNQAAGEVCDAGSANGAYGGECNAGCSGLGPSCGDGALDAADEVCDVGMPQAPHRLCNQCKSLACEAGWDDCDGKPDNGCEIDLESDKHHCGSCGMDCGLFSCNDGDCGL